MLLVRNFNIYNDYICMISKFRRTKNINGNVFGIAIYFIRNLQGN